MFSRFRKGKWMLSLLPLVTALSLNAAEYSPNFKGTDIKEFINLVGKNLQKTIIVDPNVKGKVNVRSYGVLNEEQYYDFFLHVLDVYGYAVVEMENDILKVLRAKDAKVSSIPVVGEDDDVLSGVMVTRVFPVKNVSVRELAPLLRQLVPQGGAGNVVSYDPSNVLMFTGPQALVERMVKIVRRVDKAGDADVDIIKLEYASAPEIVRIVESINKPTTGGKSNTPQFLIPKVVADERTNSVIISGEAKARQRAAELVRQLDSELESDGNTKVFYIKYAKAEDLVKVLEGVSDSIAAETDQGKKNASRRNRSNNRDFSIESHEDTNALVITAQPDMMRSLESVIRQLDVRPLQVQVEAIIVEVLEGNGADLGVQWLSKDGGLVQFNTGTAPGIGSVAVAGLAAEGTKGTTTITVDANGRPVTTSTPDEQGDYTAIASLLGSVNGTMFGVIKDDWGALINAVNTSTNANVLSRPNITTLDNQEADFLVGEEVPTVTGSSTGSNNSNPFQTVERTDVGIKLKVTPQINEGNAVKLLIEQEVSSVSGTTAVDIRINKRELKTAILAEDGDTIVLGGLIDDDVQESVSKVPLLGDIPILGKLFSSTSTKKTKRNLMVFIRPTIIKDSDTMNQISHRKYNYMRAKQLKREGEGIKLMPEHKTQPTLPNWDDALTLPPSFEDYLEQKEAELEEQDD